jgi:hypothetical protein
MDFREQMFHLLPEISPAGILSVSGDIIYPFNFTLTISTSKGLGLGY